MLFAKEFLDGNDSQGKKMSVGIHTACTVTSVEVGDRWIDFNYAAPTGEVHNKRVWFPELDKVRLNEGESLVDGLKRAEEEEFGHIVKHMRIFLSPDEINQFAASDLRSAAMKCQALLAPRLASKKVNIKILYDKDGKWTEIPKGKFASYIEEYVEGEEPKLKFTAWEKANRITAKADPVEDKDDTILY